MHPADPPGLGPKDGSVVQVTAHVPARGPALPPSATAYVGTASGGRFAFVVDPGGGWNHAPEDEAVQRQRVLGLYWDFFPQRGLIKGIVYGLPDESRRADFRAAYTITLWSADGLLSAATVRPLRFPRHLPVLEIACAMTRPGLERQGFGALLAGAVLREAEAQGFAAVYVKAERNVTPFWCKQGFTRAPFPPHVDHLCLRSEGTESLVWQVRGDEDSEGDSTCSTQDA
eukprot:EG_transcript_12308